MSKICTAQEAVASIESCQAVACAGVIGWLTPDALLRALGERYETEHEPRDLSFYFPITAEISEQTGHSRISHDGNSYRTIHPCNFFKDDYERLPITS